MKISTDNKRKHNTTPQRKSIGPTWIRTVEHVNSANHCPTVLSPVPGVFVAAGGVLQLWGGGVSAVLQHVIWQVCEQLLQLRREKKYNQRMKMSHRGCPATEL